MMPSPESLIPTLRSVGALLDDGQAPAIARSSDDLSVNVVWHLPSTSGQGRAIEARYVRRSDDYFIVYLSSHTGCSQACRFCHLTATRQVTMDDATAEDFERQALHVLAHYDAEVAAGRQARAARVHFNWMARGEPLLNPEMTQRPDRILPQLARLAAARGLACQFNVSTIFPGATALDTLEPLASQPGVQLFYSLYSLEPAFRKRWLPKARDPHQVLEWLARMQQKHRVPVTLHWALIDGANDSESVAQDVAAAVDASGVRAKFNLVRYNPFSDAQGREAGEQAISTTFSIMSRATDASRSRVVPRVGFDVKASCGMFVQG
jgi:23S rRNA (adenine2503-C2)-methyltransferase